MRPHVPAWDGATDEVRLTEGVVKDEYTHLNYGQEWLKANLDSCREELEQANRDNLPLIRRMLDEVAGDAAVLQAQVTRPPESVGVNTTFTVVPTEVLLPAMAMTPAVVTEPPVILPAVVTVKPRPALDNVLSTVLFSTMVVLKPAAASTSSETRARIV